MPDDNAGKELGAWFRDNEDLLYRMVWAQFRRLNINDNLDDVEMAVADAMRRAWEYKHLYRGGNLKAWISSVVHTSCQEILREHGAESKRRKNFVEHLGIRGSHTAPSPEHMYTQREQIRNGLGVMSDAERRAVVMRFIGYDYHEIASEMGLTFWQVRNYLARGRTKARQNDIHRKQ